MNLAGNHPRPMARKGCSYVTRIELPERGLKAGDPYPYQEYGQSEIEAYNLHRAGVLAVAVDSESSTVMMTITPGETVSVRTPEQVDARRGKRR